MICEASPRSKPGIVWVAAIDEQGEVRRAGATGCDACLLLTPIRESALVDCVQRVLNNRTQTKPSLRQVEGHFAGGENSNNHKNGSRFAGRRVLLVEDNIVNQKVAAALLKKLGCRVDVAANGREALALIEQLPYELVFMDCQMPELDGYQATRELRLLEGAVSHTPIVALTAGAMAEDRERCMQAGMDDYLSKPVRPRQLSEMVAKYLQ